VTVTRVSGTLRAPSRRSLEANVGQTISRYLDAAFVGGTYPRSDFSQAFTAFVPSVRAQARRDAWLLTNKGLGPSTRAVTPREQAAYLSVLAPYKVAAGVTARLNLRYVADRGDQPAKQVTVGGRLVLTRQSSGGWAIYGYHLTRSVTTLGKGTR
jgi:hypothetical protein